MIRKDGTGEDSVEGAPRNHWGHGHLGWGSDGPARALHSTSRPPPMNNTQPTHQHEKKLHEAHRQSAAGCEVCNAQLDTKRDFVQFRKQFFCMAHAPRLDDVTMSCSQRAARAMILSPELGFVYALIACVIPVLANIFMIYTTSHNGNLTTVPQ